MKILYSAGNRPGAQQQAIDIIRNCNIHCPQHTFKLSAYLQSSTKMPIIDWLLDPIINKYGKIEEIVGNRQRQRGRQTD